MLCVVATFQIATVLQAQYKPHQHTRRIRHNARQGMLQEGTFLFVQCPRLLLAGAIAVGDITTIGALKHLYAV